MPWAERFRAVAFAGALIFSEATACTPATSGKTPRPDSRPTVAPTTLSQPAVIRAEPIPGSVWTIKEPDNSYTKNAAQTSPLLTGEQMIVRDSTGRIAFVDRNLNTAWRSEAQGTPATADGEKFVALMSGDNLFHLFDIKSKKEIATLPSEYKAVPKDQLPVQFSPIPRFVGNLLVVPYKATLPETLDGFTVYDKNNGQRLWGTREKQASFALLETGETYLLAGSGKQIFVLSMRDGNSVLQVDANPKPETTDQWVYATKGKYLVTLFQDGQTFGLASAGKEPSQVALVRVYDLNTGKNVFEGKITPGMFNKAPEVNKDATCLGYCNPSFDRLYLKDVYNLLDQALILSIKAEGRLKPETVPYIRYYPYTNYHLIFGSSSTSYKNPREFGLSPSRDASGSDGYMNYGSADAKEILYYNTNALAHTLEGKQRSFLLYAMYPENGKLALRSVTWKETDILTYLGGDGKTFAFTNWPQSSDFETPQSLVFYGINPSQDKTKPIWTQSLGPASQAKMLTASNIVWIVADSLYKMDLISGEVSKPLASIPPEMKKAEIVEKVLWVTTTDGKISTYILN